MNDLLTNDLRWAWRALRRRPLQSAAAAATLAVAIATVTTALGLLTATAEPALLVAVTTARSVEFWSADTSG